MTERTDQRPVWRQPVWIAGHVVAAVGIVVFSALGFWQLSRHQERADLDATLRDRLVAAPISVEAADAAPIDDVEYRPVSALGVYVADEEVVWRARTRSGLSGHHVVVPLQLADGRLLLVDRGWVPIEFRDPGTPQAAPPAGTVEVEGLVRRTQSAAGLGPRDPIEGELQRISRLIPERLAEQLPAPVVTAWYLQRTTPEVGALELPLIGTLPEPGGGPPHLSYAVQWWVFAGVVAVGYPVLLNRTARRRRRPGR